MGTFLDKAKMIQKYAILRGIPKTLLKDLGNVINKASKSTGGTIVEFQFKDDPERFLFHQPKLDD